jgi:hypothetical protein
MERDIVRQLIGDLEREVNNGGFDQFFFNPPGGNAPATIEALEAVGAHKTAAIVRRACARFPGGMPPEERIKRQKLLLSTVSPDSDGFEDDDDAFYEYEDDLQGLVAAFE